jgi:hypothetical protein
MTSGVLVVRSVYVYQNHVKGLKPVIGIVTKIVIARMEHAANGVDRGVHKLTDSE